VNSQLDDVNELLKLKQGDLVRLAHIKKTLESRNVLYISDSKYLRELTKAYLEDHTGERFAKYNSYDYPEYSNRLKETSNFEPKLEPENKKESENSHENVKDKESRVVKSEIKESEKNSFCGNCGNEINDENFCPKCGTSLHSEESSSNIVKEKDVKINFKNEKKPNKKLTVIIILSIIIIVSAVGIGNQMSGDIKISDIANTIPTSNTNDVLDSKCGAGLVFDEANSSCVIEGSVVVGETNPKCGAGLVFDEANSSCVIEGSVVVGETNPKCGAGLVFDEANSSCVIDK